MTARVNSLVNRVAAAIVRRLKVIDSDLDATRWLTKPKVKRGFIAADLQGERPALLLVTAGKQPDRRAVDSVTHESVIDFSIVCLAADPDDPDEALWNLIADVEEALAEAETLEGLALKFDVGDISAAREAAEQSGRANATIDLKVLARWQHGAP